MVDQIIVARGGPAYDRAGFDELQNDVRTDLPERVARLAIIAGGVLAAADGVLEHAGRLEKRAGSDTCAPAVEDVRRQVSRLVQQGFVSSAGPGRLRDLLRYLEAASRRIERLPGDVRRDRARQQVVERVQSRYESLLERLMAGTIRPSSRPGLASIRWMIEELRVSLWAQSLGTSAPVSEERIAGPWRASAAEKAALPGDDRCPRARNIPGCGGVVQLM